MPELFLIYGIGIATVATIIASQAMITGAFTLISEAVRLNLWPKVKINYPSNEKGQLYVPSTNWILYVGCVLVVLIFQKSSNMEHAYGLTIIMSMMITTMLMTVYLRSLKYPIRSEESRVGKECVSKCRSRCSQLYYKKNKKKYNLR